MPVKVQYGNKSDPIQRIYDEANNWQYVDDHIDIIEDYKKIVASFPCHSVISLERKNAEPKT